MTRETAQRFLENADRLLKVARSLVVEVGMGEHPGVSTLVDKLQAIEDGLADLRRGEAV